ncbi:MAG: hypothetical protein JF622_08305 [Terrabacter sp.]|nr:hypothetical protein [Terrabacter sp.]
MSRTVQEGAGAADESSAPELTPVVSPGEPVAGAVGIGGGADLAAADGTGVLAAEADEASQRSQDEAAADEGGFGGPHTPLSESPGAAESWDRDAEDEDALLPRSSVEAAVVAHVAEATPDDDVTPAIAPVAEANPNGDLAGVAEPEAVAALDEAAEGDDVGSSAEEVSEVDPSSADDLDVDESEEPAVNVAPVADATPSGDPAGVGGPGARATQGELTFDEPEDSVPPEEKP